MKTKHLFLTIILAAWCSVVTAQLEIPMIGFNQVPVVYNPALSASVDGLDFHGSYQNYWMGFENAPEAINFNIFGNIGENMGVSFNLHRTNIHIFNQTQVEGGYSYRIRLSSESLLSFGLSLGLRNISARQSANVMDQYDPVLDSDLFHQAHFSTGAGVAYQWKQLSVGVAAPQVFFRSDFYNKYMVMVGYDYLYGNNFTFKPVLMYRRFSPVKNDFQARLQVNYQNQVHVETGFGTDIFFLVGVGFTMNRLRFGYTYAALQPSFSGISGGTNSVYMIYNLPRGKQPDRVRYNIPRQ